MKPRQQRMLAVGLAGTGIVIAAALTLQAISRNPSDSAGIMNQAALVYWNDHSASIPLSREAFLDAPDSFNTRVTGQAEEAQ